MRGSFGVLVWLLGVALGWLVGLGSVASASADDLPPAPTAHVTDAVGLLSQEAVARIDQGLSAYEAATGHQIVVWIADTLEGRNLEDFCARTFAAWKLGRSGHDDGLAIFVFSGDRKLRIEVGYGLEERVTDVVASQVIRHVLAPGLASGRPEEGIVAAVSSLARAIDPNGPPVFGMAPSGGIHANDPEAPPELSFAEKVFLAILGIAFLVLLVTHPRLAVHLLFVLASGGRGSGGLGGGPSFRGGGGRSGGGGASGGW